MPPEIRTVPSVSRVTCGKSRAAFILSSVSARAPPVARTARPASLATNSGPPTSTVDPAATVTNQTSAADAKITVGDPLHGGYTVSSSTNTFTNLIPNVTLTATAVQTGVTVSVKSDAVRQALEYYKKLAQWLPPDAPAWDNASNNKYLIAGKGSLIMNPPSAWAVAKRDAPQVAEQLWTHGMPAGPKGRYAPFLPYFYGIWNFGKNKSAAKSLLVYLSQPAAVEAMVNASFGYDLPAFEKFTTFKVWAEEGPPKGTLYHYPNPHNHQILSVAAQPAPPKIAVQIYTQAIQTKMVVRFMQGEPLERTLAWAETEVEGFMRT